ERGHRWSLDDLVTAWVAAEVMREAPPRRFADLGCGIGAVLLLLAWRFPAARGLGIEAQAVSVRLARRSAAWNGADTRCEIRHADLRTATSDGIPFDLVTGTPPYLPIGTAHASSRPQVADCHLEQRGGVEEYCQAAARLLRPGGWFVTCVGGTQHERVHVAADRAGLAIIRRRDVVPRAGKRVLFSVFALRGEPAVVEVDEPLVVRDATGQRTPAFRALRASMGMPP